MRSIFLCLALCLCVIAQNSKSSHTFPVISWSNTKFFAAHNQQVNDIVSSSELKEAFEGKKSNELFGIADVDVFVVIPISELRSETLSRLAEPWQHLQTLLPSESTSIVWSYVEGEEEILSGPQWNPSEALPKGERVVQVQGTSELSHIHQMLTAHHLRYVALVTASPSAAPRLRRTFPTDELPEFAVQFPQSQLLADSSLWPAGVVEALLVMVPFLGILWIGVSCTFSVQSALKFDADRKTQ